MNVVKNLQKTTTSFSIDEEISFPDVQLPPQNIMATTTISANFTSFFMLASLLCR